MAALVLSIAGAAAGSAVLGPVGAIVGRLVGAVAGNVIDQALFGARRQASFEGPRLADLTVMASTEGAPIARVYALLNVRFGSFAAELFSLRADLCPLLVQQRP
jgi:phage tail tape-measure protein